MRSDADVQQEINKLVKIIDKDDECIRNNQSFLSRQERRKIKCRISRLKNINIERIREEQRRRNNGAKKRIAKPKVKEDKKRRIIVAKPIEVYDLPPDVQAIVTEYNKPKWDFKPNRSTKWSRVTNKYHKCADCKKPSKRVFTNLVYMNQNKYFCEKCSKKYKNLFEINL